jgi:hypothetical protein
MARTLSRRSAVAAVAIVALGLTACGKNDPGAVGSGPPSGDQQIGGAPPASTTPTPAATPTRGGGKQTPLYPRDARSYGQEFLRAWNTRNFTRLGQLGDTGAVQQVRDSIDNNGLPNTQWTHIRCGPTEQMPTNTTCVFRNAHGDETALEMINMKLGAQNAVTKAPLDRTRYPDDPVGYVSALLGAHTAGNTQRVLRLSNSVVRRNLTCTLSGGSTSRLELIDSMYSRVIVSGEGPELGKSYMFKVFAQPGGKPNAVKEVTNGC